MESRQQYYSALTGLRGIGAVWVTLFHLLHTSANQVIKSGYLGVDLFFLLSGFIITHVHQADFRNGYELRTHFHFLKLRLVRIYPLHFVILVVFGIFAMLAPDFIDRYPHPERFEFGAFIATLFLVQNWGIGPGTLWNMPTWSLSAEWLAYLLFPFISIGVAKLRPRYALVAALCVLALMELVFLHFGHREDTGKAGLLRIACEFVAGCLVYQHVRAADGRTAPLTGWIAVVLLGVSVSVPGLYFLATTSFVLLVAAVVSGGSRLGAVLASRPMTLLGDLSFSLYLCHWPLIQVRNWAVDKGYIGATPGFIALVPAIVVVTWICWACVEKPARRLGRRLIAEPPRSHAGVHAVPERIAQETPHK